MKRLAIKLSVLAIILFLVDRLIGIGLSYLDRISETEAGCGYIMHQVDHDILVFGSSRAYRHYDTRILSDSLGMSCYNCGKSGQGFIYNYVLLKAITERYTPKMIIYDIYPPADFADGDNTRYITELRPYRNNKEVFDVLVDVDPLERYKTLSLMYCYNHICNEIILNYLNPNSRENSINGFVPTKKVFNPHKIKKVVKSEGAVDSLKLKYAELFIQLAKNSNLILAISPYWINADSEYVTIAKELADKYGVPFLDFSSDEYFVHNNEYFFDSIHMNDKGAERFTKELINQLF